MSAKNLRNVIIIGSGHAGLTAALYTARANLKPLLIAGLAYGGQLMTTSLVENYPGFPDGIQGPELMERTLQQVKNQGAEIINQDVTKIDLKSQPKKVWVGQDEYQAQAVILTVGSSPRRLNVPGEQEYWGKGVSTCATCDGAFYKQKIVAVIGGGDSAMEESTFLTKFASQVYIVHRRSEFRASQVMQKRVLQNDKIKVIWDSEVEAVAGDKTVKSLQLKNINTGEASELKVDGMFLAIGHIPNTKFLRGQLDMDEHGYIKYHDNVKTSVAGVFAAGEIIDSHYKQAIVSAGMGSMAAIDAEKWLSENNLIGSAKS